MMGKRKRAVALLLGASWGAALAGPAWAQEAATADADNAVTSRGEAGGVPDIVVTADRQTKTIQTTPIAVSVVGGEQVQKEGRSKLDDVLINQPAVVVQGVAKGLVVSIRGLGLSLPPQNGQGAVSTNYDGIYSVRSEAASAGFYDLDRVEILRGPQSTLYGRTAIGGVVNVISRDPRLGDFGGYAQGEAGSYSLFRGEGALNVPLGDKAAFRLSGAGVTRHGYLNNDHDDNKATALRGKLLFQPADDVKLLAGIEWARLRGKGPGAIPIANFPDHKRTTDDPAIGFQSNDTWKYWLSLSAGIGPGVLSVLPSYIHSTGEALGAFGGNFSFSADPRKNNQKALEVRYSSRAGAAFEWAAGYYYYRQFNSQGTVSGACNGTNGIFVPPAGFTASPGGPPGAPIACYTTPIPVNYGDDIRRSQTDGVFGQTTFPVLDHLRLILGARYTWEGFSGRSDFNNGCTAVSVMVGACPSATPDVRNLVSVKDKHFDYRGGLEFDVLPTSLLYATVASGYRQGGYGFGSNPSAYSPEKMRSYEVGLKNKLFDNKVFLNFDAFYYDYDKYQLVLIINQPPGSPFPFLPDVQVTPAREYGVEAEVAAALTSVDRLTASVVYLNSRILGTSAFRDGDFPNTPRWTVKAGYSHEFDLSTLGTLTPRFDGRYLSSQIVYPRAPSDPPAQFAESTQKSYFTGDFFVAYTSPSAAWGVTAYIKNINNKAIKQSDFFGYVQVAPPRTIGATVNVKF